jgi:hypothetical protein
LIVRWLPNPVGSKAVVGVCGPKRRSSSPPRARWRPLAARSRASVVESRNVTERRSTTTRRDLLVSSSSGQGAGPPVGRLAVPLGPDRVCNGALDLGSAVTIELAGENENHRSVRALLESELKVTGRHQAALPPKPGTAGRRVPRYRFGLELDNLDVRRVHHRG